jgi:hypothetical protein
MKKPLLILAAWMAYAFFFLPTYALWANDCATAVPLTLGVATTVTADGLCDYQADHGLHNQYPCNPAAWCPGDAWFQFIPGGTNLLNYDVRFNISITSPNGSLINCFILYSESKDAGVTPDPCSWGTNTPSITRYNSLCNIWLGGNGNMTIPFDNYGMDGSGTFYLVVEQMSGIPAVDFTVTPVILGTCTPPTNDRCQTPTLITLGNGIDSQSAFGAGSGTWAEATSGSTRCATKQRLDDKCAAPFTQTSTEDHYDRRPFGQCWFKGNIGDLLGPPFTNQADEYLENTVYYRFQVPVTANDWYIHIGSTSPCAQQPNNMVAMLFQNIDCNNADNSNRMYGSKFSILSGMPSADLIFDGSNNYDGSGPGMTLNAGSNYHLVFDGTRGSQCDFQILITRSPINPVLPARITAFEGYNEGRNNHLAWIAEAGADHAFFVVERSLDGTDFSEIGRLDEGGFADGEHFTFTDPFAPTGLGYYRIQSVDISGGTTRSEVVVITRESLGLELLELKPIPAQGHLTLAFSIVSDAQPVELSLTDLTGRQVLRHRWAYAAGTYEERLDLQGLAAGLYVLQLRQGAQRLTRRVVKQ